MIIIESLHNFKFDNKYIWKHLSFDIPDNEKLLIVLEQYNNLLSNTDDNNVIKAILEQTLKAYEKEEKIEN